MHYLLAMMFQFDDGTNQMINLLGNKATSSLIIIYLVNYMKQSKLFPWFTMETQRLNHLLMVFLTFAASMGVHFVWDPKEHELAIQGLALATILPALWHWAQQYVMTKVGYHVLQSKLPTMNGNGKPAPPANTGTIAVGGTLNK